MLQLLGKPSASHIFINTMSFLTTLFTFGVCLYMLSGSQSLYYYRSALHFSCRPVGVSFPITPANTPVYFLATFHDFSIPFLLIFYVFEVAAIHPINPTWFSCRFRPHFLYIRVFPDHISHFPVAFPARFLRILRIHPSSN